MRAALILLCCTGCSWGVGEYVGFDARQREELARDSHARVEEVKEILPAEAFKEVEVYLERIQVNCVDQVQRAEIIQAGNKYPPKEVPDLRSPADNEKVQEGAGLNRAKEVKREIIAELPARALKGVATLVKDVIPWWIYCILFVMFGGLGLLARVWQQGRAALDGMIKIGNKKGAKEAFRGQTNGLVKKRYRKLRDKGLLEADEEQEERVD